MATDYTGGTANCSTFTPNTVYGFPITITGNGNVTTIGVNWCGTQTGNVRVALYSAGVGKPANLLTESASVAMVAAVGWQDIAVAAYAIVAGSYWVAIQLGASKDVYYDLTGNSIYTKSYGPFDAVWSAGSSEYPSGVQFNMRVTYLAGWTGKISGVTNPAAIMGVLVANMATAKGVP